MATYLGENKNKFLSLIQKEIVDNKITQHDLSNDKGEFTGYKVVYDGESGFAYYHDGGNFYEFSPVSDCTVIDSKEIPLAITIGINATEYNSSILQERDEDTKLVDTHRISFVNQKMETKRLFGIKSVVHGVPGFSFQEKQIGLYSADQDKTKSYFIKASDVVDHGYLSSKELITQSERKAIKDFKDEEETNNNLGKLKSLKVSIEKFDSAKDSWRLKQIIKRVENLSIKEEEISGDYSIGALVKKITSIGIDRKNDRVNSELRDFGVTIEVEDNLKNEEISISILDNKGKPLSKITVNKVLFESEEIRIDDSDTTVEMVVLDLDDDYEIEGKNITVEEKGKNITFEKSKFKDIYKLFDEDAHVVSHGNILELENELKTKDGEFDFTISSLDLTHSLNVKTHLLESIKKSKDLQKSIKKSLKSSSPKLK